ncbi:hypothetical protein QCN29_18590 [Streptomyces sp. HNM0663]|uniref:Uncharacterized protein n=1 Tax=Streptomyces chengmaiensis TaxID=3040919 RepID=A0ABT6HQY9_9ACTN|nr:hypothetical protein [Streptomyces chengmaiensis]MDH2390760.1 hypothetical protein [Streptomyces chengmaiensis]
MFSRARRRTTSAAAAGLTLLTAAALLTGLAPGAATAAGAAPDSAAAADAARGRTEAAASEDRRNSYTVVATADDLVVPAVARPGPASFAVSTTDATAGQIGLVRLRRPDALEDFRTGLRMSFSDDRDESVRGAALLSASAELLGGALTKPGHPVTFTQLLRPGSYLLIEYKDFQNRELPVGEERIGTLAVSGGPAGRPPAPRAVVASYDRPGAGARYLTPRTLRAGEPLLFFNALDQVNEAAFYKLHPGKTAEDVHRFFVAVDNHDWSVPPPFPLGSVGTPPVSPGRSVVVRVPFTPGEYALVTWVADVRDGHKLAAKGTHTVVTVE